MSPKQPAAPERFGSVRQLACFWFSPLELGAKPALDVKGADGVDLAELAGEDHLAGLANERVAGVVVRDAEDDAGLVDDLRQLLRLGEIERQRLVADDIEARLGDRLRDLEVRVVRRRDRDEVDSLVGRQLEFRGDQLGDGAVRSIRLDVEVGRRRLGPGRIAGESPGDELGPIIENRGDGVDLADEGPLSAADEGHAKMLRCWSATRCS